MKGWLLLLCLLLTVFDPSVVLVSLYAVSDGAMASYDLHPEVFRLIVVSGILRIGLAVFSIYAGLSLWKLSAQGRHHGPDLPGCHCHLLSSFVVSSPHARRFRRLQRGYRPGKHPEHLAHRFLRRRLVRLSRPIEKGRATYLRLGDRARGKVTEVSGNGLASPRQVDAR